MEREEKQKEFHYIDESITIDFPIPTLLKNTLLEAEELDREDSPEYSHVADAIDVMCKGMVKTRILTQEQWDLIVQKYPYV